MQKEEQPERPLRWFVLPNESYKWDFILEKYGDEQQEAIAKRRGAVRTTGRLTV